MADPAAPTGSPRGLRRGRRSRGRGAAVLAAVALLALAGPAFGQATGATGSLERFQPAPAGDAMFGVPSPSVGGHLVPRVAAIVDYAYHPLSIDDGTTEQTIVSEQLFLHLNASFALFDRVLVSADMPFALAQGGDSPTVAGVRFDSPSGAEVGDLRLGARLRLFGEYWDPLQVGIGGYVFVPTAADGYAGDGAVRGQPHLLVGGRFQHFVYSASVGATLRGSDRPHSVDLGAGAAVVLGEEVFQIGPEVTLRTPFSKDVLGEANGASISVASQTSAELLLGAKVRPVRPLVIGAGAGPGLTQGYGTPVFFAVGSIGYEPLPPRHQDTDSDGILDEVDACPAVPGVRSDDPAKNGCPPDRDADGIIDAEDACPEVRGVRSADPKKNGCPPDTDGDGVLDAEDACPKVPGPASADPKKNGCPPETDRDGDTIMDGADACPDVAGVASADPKKNGCPPDRDGDNILDPVDACPDERGGPDPDPKKHGCPHVTVTKTEIEISKQVQFKYGRSTLDQTIDPVSDDLLIEVKNAIEDHPEIELIEVQGHADNIGGHPYNLQLSQARANAVRAWLVERGIPADKLVAKGYGARVPLGPNETEEGRQKNRRVQFMIVKKPPAP